jgi:hypothetical protein
MSAPLILLPTDEPVRTTTYAWPEGYRPTVVADNAIRGRTGCYVLGKAEVTVRSDGTHSVALYGWPVRAQGGLRTDTAPKWLRAAAVEREVWQQHLRRGGGAT